MDDHELDQKHYVEALDAQQAYQQHLENQITELRAQSNYFEGAFCDQKRITTELQAQVDAYKQALHDAWAIKGET